VRIVSTELLASGCEQVALRKHIGRGPYPEYLPWLDEIQTAVASCAAGYPAREVLIDRATVHAAPLVCFLGLEEFVVARRKAALN
jgi:hypothetical protein